jgi:hypothetical protein
LIGIYSLQRPCDPSHLREGAVIGVGVLQKLESREMCVNLHFAWIGLAYLL